MIKIFQSGNFLLRDNIDPGFTLRPMVKPWLNRIIDKLITIPFGNPSDQRKGLKKLP